MIQTEFGPKALLFLDGLSHNDRVAFIDFLSDEICTNPYLEPDNPDTNKYLYYDESEEPPVYTIYGGDDWWVQYRVARYLEDGRFTETILVADIGEILPPE